jgi:16S rRNA (guanine527-N7)-methyltransferase
MNLQTALKKHLEGSPAVINEEMFNNILIYSNELIEKNRQFNLTAITAPEEVAVKHVLDSVHLFGAMSGDVPLSLADAGTGAGFPGIIAAILNEKIKVTLIESNGKKANFLNSVIGKLKLNNAAVIQSRSEECSRDKKMRQKFSAVTMRAFAEFKTAMELTSALCALKGKIYYFASADQVKEIKREGNIYNELKLKFEKIYDYTLPLDLGKRHIVILSRTGDTPNCYPRTFQKIKIKSISF